jgi:uncharacterized protein YjeT (DUF2065 family)
MPEAIDMTAWSSLLLGLFALFAGIGGVRNPQAWRAMIAEVSRSSALQLVMSLAELAVGAALYLLNPWGGGDVLGAVVKVIGGLMMLEALVVAAFADGYLGFWQRIFVKTARGWALFAVLVGLALSVAGALRFA